MNHFEENSCSSQLKINPTGSRLFGHSIHLFQYHLPTAYVLLVLVEFAAFMLSFYLGIELRFWNAGEDSKALLGPLLPKAFVFACAMLLCMISLGTYQRSSVRSLGVTVIRVAGAMVLGIVPLTLSFYFAPMFFLGRGALAFAVAISFLNIVTIRAVFSELLKRASINSRILVLGVGKSAKLVFDAQAQGELNGLNIVGYTHLKNEKSAIEDHNIFDSKRSLLDIVQECQIDQIVLAVDDRRNGLPVQDILDCKMNGVSVVDLLTFFERETGKVRLDILQPSWLFLSEGFQRTLARSAAKRTFDLGVCLMLLPLAMPLMLLVALCISIEDLGRAPIFYRQVRVGQNGVPFKIIKFRSMRTDAESDGVARWAQKNDTRITHVGAFIRKTRLDELPQLVNVLLGEMSFVGPRPERPEFTQELSKSIPYYNERHRVKPGLTGWAQIRYAYGASQEDAVEKLQLDLFYVKNYSIFMDLIVLLQTAEVVLLGKGAH